uniref:BPTI/Kunitz inhibitor domain-containing protein n=1 Tax=Pseudonaja textilis TaxID=8673 RepID=A0A670ZP83_PSETE
MLPIRPSWAEPVVKKKLRQSAERRKERKAQAFLFFLLSADWRCRPRPVWGIALVHDYQTGSATGRIPLLVMFSARQSCMQPPTGKRASQEWVSDLFHNQVGHPVETVLGFLLCFPEDCELPPDKGPADNLELRWFHNSKSKRCERFFYGGCYGNANNYKDINECDRCCVSPGEGRVWSEGGPLALGQVAFVEQSYLGRRKKRKERKSDQCQLPRNQGSCSKELQHFYYDPEEKKCISFVYHGCEGNSNNFPTRELCEKACGKISKGTEEACCIEVPAVLGWAWL